MVNAGGLQDNLVGNLPIVRAIPGYLKNYLVGAGEVQIVKFSIFSFLKNTIWSSRKLVGRRIKYI